MDETWLPQPCQARSIRNKANRGKHTQNHTFGSKSIALVNTEMTEELKRPPRRHELFSRTHAHKSEVPQKEFADLELLGTRMHTSTKFQMEMEVCSVADQKAENMQEQMDVMMQQMADLRQMMAEIKDDKKSTDVPAGAGT